MPTISFEEAEEATETGLADELSAAWDAHVESSEEPETAPEPIEDATGRLRDPVTKRFIARPREEEVAEESSPSIFAPEHWRQQDRDAFNSLPEEIKPQYLEKVRNLERGYQQKFEEVANERKSYEGLREIFGENELQQIAAANTTVPQYIGRLVSVGRQLQANPQATIHWLADQYGVELGGSGPDLNELGSLASLREQVLDEVAGLKQQMEHERQSRFDQEWAAFAREYRVPDSLKRPMGTILALNPERPTETTRQALLRAYELARWTDPEIRQSILESEKRAEEAERRRKADLDRAKKAGRIETPRGKTAPNSDSRAPAASWRDELEANWDAIS